MIAFVYDIIYLVSLSLIPSLWAVFHAYEDVSLFPVFLASAAVSSVILIFMHLKNSGKIILGGVLITIAAASVLLLPDTIKSTIITDHPQLVMTLLISAGVTIAGKILCSFRFARPVISGLLIASLAFSMYRNMCPPKSVVAFVFFFVLCTFADEIQTGWKKNGKLPGKKHLVFISPFLALFLILMLTFPAPEDPYDWALAKKIVETASDRIYRIKEYFYSLAQGDSADSFLGFSEFASLGSGRGDNDKKVLEVTQINGSSTYAYLAGKTFDTFDGSEWYKTYEDDGNDSLIDCLETLYSAKLYAGEDHTDYVRRGQLDITVLNMYTNHYFTPHKYFNFLQMNEQVPYYSEGGDPFSYDRITYGDTYSTEYFRLNTDSPAFGAFLDSRPDDDPSVWSETLNTLYVHDVPDISLNDLEEYRARMKEFYLGDIEISPELADYLDELFADCTTDSEKLKKLEKLFNSMRYNIMVGELPGDVNSSSEFLDYLILEKQEGYCVYYATAFVLISRYIGIPARFVQGYRIELRGHGGSVVTESRAHAWPECYLEGIGWIAYEPTPGYRASERWKTSDELTEERERIAVQDPYQAYQEEIALPETVMEEHEESEKIDWRYPALIAFSSVSVALLLLIMIRIIGMIRYRLSDDERKFNILFSRNMKLLKIPGFSKPDEETFEEFGKRVSGELPAELLTFIDTYETYAYRGDVISGKDVEQIRTSNRKIIDHIKKTGLMGRLSLIRYYLFSA